MYVHCAGMYDVFRGFVLFAVGIIVLIPGGKSMKRSVLCMMISNCLIQCSTTLLCTYYNYDIHVAVRIRIYYNNY